MSTTTIHDWFRDSLDAYLTRGLSAEEQAKFEAHAAMCAACDAALLDAKNADAALRDLFASCAPPPTFEDRLLEQLRTIPQRHRWIHPAVWRFAGGIAAAVMLGLFGVAGNAMLKDGKMPAFSLPKLAFLGMPAERRVKTSSHLRQIGDPLSNQNSNNFPAEFDRQLEKSGAETDGKKIPYDDVLRYPAGWGEISEMRDASVQANGGQDRAKLSWGFDSAASSAHESHDFYFRTPNELAKDVKNSTAMGRSAGEHGYLATRAPVSQSGIERNGTVTVPDGGTLLLGGQVLNGIIATPSKPGTPTEGTIQTPQINTTNAIALKGNNTYTGGTTVSGGTIVVTSTGLTKTGTGKMTLNGGTVDAHYYSNEATAPKPADPKYFKPPTVELYADVSGKGIVKLGDGEVGKDGAKKSTEVNSLEYRNAGESKIAVSAGGDEDFGLGSKKDAVSAGSTQGFRYSGQPKKDVAPQNGDLSLRLNDTSGPTDGPAKPTGITQREAELRQFPLLTSKVSDSDKDSVIVADGKQKPDHKDDTILPPVLVADGNTDPATPKADGGEAKPKPPVTVPPVAPTAIAERKIIRNGQMEFEVDSFDSAFVQIGKIAAEETGYVSSTDSEKLPNGKVKGTITLRVPPDHLDVLVLKLRGLGELKTQRIAAQDVTKQYTDFESQLKAAHTMEDRLLEIIKGGKGAVKDLVEAEKQLDINRQKIEQIEGELRFYNNLVSLSTLNVTLFERDLKTPSAAFETEEVNAGIEADDVDKARAEALKAIEELKGRIVESTLKRLDAGQLAATIIAEVSPDATGPLSDRLKQLGRVARMEAERKITTTGGVGAPTGVKLERRPTKFNISLYNLANIAPRETFNVNLAAPNVEAAYKAIIAAINADDAKLGRIVSSSLNSQKSDQTTGSISLEVKTEKSAVIDAALAAAGTVMHLTVTENPDANSVTRAKRGYSITLVPLANVPPRETQAMNVAAKNVPAVYAKLLAVLQDPKQPARILTSQLNEQDRQNITGSVDFEIPRAAAATVEATLANGTDSDVYTRVVSRSSDTDNTLDTKVRLTVSLINADQLAPREATTIGVDVSDVEKSISDTSAVIEAVGGRVLDRRLYKLADGQIGAHLLLDVPLSAAGPALDKLRGLGVVRSVDSAKNQQVPDGPLARARFDVTLGNPTPILSTEDGVGARLRQGLRTSMNGLTWSLMLVVIGVCLIGPFLLVGWAGWKILRRGRGKPAVVKA